MLLAAPASFALILIASAKLFYRSGWTQEELAKAEGKSQRWIDQRLRFGRFLNFTTTVVNLESISERRFRGFWARSILRHSRSSCPVSSKPERM